MALGGGLRRYGTGSEEAQPGSLRSMTAIWMGLARVAAEVAAGRVQLDGDPGVARAMPQWLGLSPFAPGQRRVA